MPEMIDAHYLLTDQYTNASKLKARIQLHERFSTSNQDWHNWVFERFTFPRGARLLELGCGPGTLWQKNLASIPTDWEITLSDFSPGMLQEAQQNLEQSHGNFSFQVVNAQEIPFADNTFDGIIANHMLYHVPDRAQAFAEIRRVLRPQGRFYATTNGEKHLQEMHTLMEQAGIPLNGTVGISGFTPENGAAQLAHWFSRIELLDYKNDLQVTEAEPLIAFILSAVKSESVDAQKLQKLRDNIYHELGTKGSIFITKATGLFIASGEK
jgi:ubiquinone/menaquinone biosynthesis C-methylase UbiE